MFNEQKECIWTFKPTITSIVQMCNIFNLRENNSSVFEKNSKKNPTTEVGTTNVSKIYVDFYIYIVCIIRNESRIIKKCY